MWEEVGYYNNGYKDSTSHDPTHHVEYQKKLVTEHLRDCPRQARTVDLTIAVTVVRFSQLSHGAWEKPLFLNI